MAEKKKGGLGRGLAALIPSSPADLDAGKKTGPLGDGAADVIIGGSKGAGAKAAKASGTPTKKPKGAPSISQFAPPASQKSAVPAAIAASATAGTDSFGATYQEIPLGQIIPNEKQPRQVFEEEQLAELVHSIKEFGLLQPIVVRPSDSGSHAYELIMGERRWRAASKAGLKVIPAIVRETANEDMLRDALLENIHRVQLNPLEEAAAYEQLLEEFGVTQEQLADRLGRSRPVITNSIRLLRLPVPVQRRVAAGVLSAGHARALLGVKVGAQAQETLAERIVAEGLSVRATEEAVTLLNRGEEPAKKPRLRPAQPEYFTQTADRLSDQWDTTVKVTMGRRKGKMVIEFGDRDDFERILGLISGK
ncbi:ParB/RepB/Spo0J family partition protein [Corynebacterium aquatimens]|uniref:ParB family chromosome partitioning protein n=1 Tax=Corynebacterium aquatimens TaxID=1190508 RepID=A0A931DYI4_9CORY|nr:ParB/RepB/Spo0J family partition protein [Corynebacterium aquatimens]MBG6122717.1 ParB family chromosome partitioning protein [Corynebacterium aquatimens]WJY66946.1 putative chromosome-partitioning protein ParB [Corynebacterium aquatimens]